MIVGANHCAVLVIALAILNEGVLYVFVRLGYSRHTVGFERSAAYHVADVATVTLIHAHYANPRKKQLC